MGRSAQILTNVEIRRVDLGASANPSWVVEHIEGSRASAGADPVEKMRRGWKDGRGLPHGRSGDKLARKAAKGEIAKCHKGATAPIKNRHTRKLEQKMYGQPRRPNARRG